MRLGRDDIIYPWQKMDMCRFDPADETDYGIALPFQIVLGKITLSHDGRAGLGGVFYDPRFRQCIVPYKNTIFCHLIFSGHGFLVDGNYSCDHEHGGPMGQEFTDIYIFTGSFQLICQYGFHFTVCDYGILVHYLHGY